MITRYLSKILLVVASLGGLSGCSHPKGPECVPVSGKISYKGKPLAEAMIVLHPLDGNVEGNHKPIARSAADGTFSLTTFKSNDGAPPGRYAITVELRAPQMVGEEVVRNGENLLPVKYSKPETSGLRVAVEQGSNEVPPINLL